MNTYPGIDADRLVVSVLDRPLLIADALAYTLDKMREGESIVDNASDFELNAWISRSQLVEEFNIRGNEIRNPDAQVVLAMPIEDTETALVHYGLDPERTDEEVNRVDELLISIDSIKSQVQPQR